MGYLARDYYLPAVIRWALALAILLTLKCNEIEFSMAKKDVILLLITIKWLAPVIATSVLVGESLTPIFI